MGYITHFYGELSISPPIPWGEIKDSPFLPNNARRHDYLARDVMFRVEEQERDTADGTYTARSAVALVSTWEDEPRGYNIIEHIQEAVDTFPDHVFGGRLDAEGEDAGDVWRIKVIDGRAVRFTPQIIWPEESE